MEDHPLKENILFEDVAFIGKQVVESKSEFAKDLAVDLKFVLSETDAAERAWLDLKKQGFVYHSLSDIIREECTRRQLPHERDNLIAIGNELRATFGPGVLGKLTAEKIEKLGEQKALAVSIRNPAEIEELRRMPGFFLIAVDAPIELRFERISGRGRPEDAVTFEKFKEQENRERAGAQNEQQLNRVMVLADTQIPNSGTFAEFHQKIDTALNQIRHAS